MTLLTRTWFLRGQLARVSSLQPGQHAAASRSSRLRAPVPCSPEAMTIWMHGIERSAGQRCVPPLYGIFSEEAILIHLPPQTVHSFRS